MDMPWSLLDGAQCILEACCWYRNQQSVRECSSKYPTVLRSSSATYSVAMNAALLRIVSCSTPLSCRTTQNRRYRLGEERQQKHAFLYVRKLTQHCMSARSHIPSTDAFAAWHAWAKMHRCPHTGYSFSTHKYAGMPEQTNHRHRTTSRLGEEKKREKREESEAERAQSSKKAAMGTYQDITGCTMSR
ncbi:hypothetical protein GGI43DRAFT_177811 [Trichoderma evansii]